jgi:hypothetical protein
MVAGVRRARSPSRRNYAKGLLVDRCRGGKPEVKTMTLKFLMGTALVAVLAMPAAAQTTEFYIVRDASTKKCTIVDKKPTTTTTTVVGNGIYKTRVEAESAMKTVKVCTD